MGNGFRHICKRAHKSCCLGCKRNQTTEGKVSVCRPWTSGKVLSQKPISSLETLSGQIWTRKNIFVSLFFHASHSSRPSFQKSKTIFTAFWFRAAKEPPNFCLPCHNKKKHVNLALVKFSQHTPKMPLFFFLCSLLVTWCFCRRGSKSGNRSIGPGEISWSKIQDFLLMKGINICTHQHFNLKWFNFGMQSCGGSISFWLCWCTPVCVALLPSVDCYVGSFHPHQLIFFPVSCWFICLRWASDNISPIN